MRGLLKKNFSKEKKQTISYYTYQHITEVLKRFFQNRSISTATQYAEYHSNLKREELSHLFIWPRYFMWLIPTIGFIGTVLGIKAAIQNFNTKSVDVQIMAETLGTAFETTLFALVLSAIIAACISRREKKEENFLLRIDQFLVNEVMSEFADLNFMQYANNEFESMIEKQRKVLEELQKNIAFTGIKTTDKYSEVTKKLEDVTILFGKTIGELNNIGEKLSNNFIKSANYAGSATDKVNNAIFEFVDQFSNIANALKSSTEFQETLSKILSVNESILLSLNNRNELDKIAEILMHIEILPELKENIINFVEDSKANSIDNTLKKINEVLRQVISVKVSDKQLRYIVQEIDDKMDHKLRRLMGLEEKAEQHKTIFDQIKSVLDTITQEIREMKSNYDVKPYESIKNLLKHIYKELRTIDNDVKQYSRINEIKDILIKINEYTENINNNHDINYYKDVKELLESLSNRLVSIVNQLPNIQQSLRNDLNKSFNELIDPINSKVEIIHKDINKVFGGVLNKPV